MSNKTRYRRCELVITSEEHNALLDELIAEYSLGELEPDEVTAKMFAKCSGLSIKRASDILKERVASGELTARWVKNPDGNKRVKAYRKAKQ